VRNRRNVNPRLASNADEQVTGTLSGAGRLACYFQFDSLATVCFLSISSAADLTFLHGLREFASGTSNEKAALES
jgi:hypothetical protein